MSRMISPTWSLAVLVGCIGLTLSACNQGDDVAERSAVSTTSQPECCGKCAAEQAGAQSECCGKCQGEIENENLATNPSCSANCDACAQGKSEACQCLDESAKESVESDSASRTPKTIAQDRDVFHYLLKNHEKITRTVTELENGVQTVTESDDADVVAKLQDHVASMHGRIVDGRRLRMWDDLYREIFNHHDKIEMEIKNTPNGISVTETSDDRYVVDLIKSHASVVSGFASKGFEEARENHPVPPKSD